MDSLKSSKDSTKVATKMFNNTKCVILQEHRKLRQKPKLRKQNIEFKNQEIIMVLLSAKHYNGFCAFGFDTNKQTRNQNIV